MLPRNVRIYEIITHFKNPHIILLTAVNKNFGCGRMLNRNTNTFGGCSCAVRTCVARIVGILAIILGVVVGLIVGAMGVATIIEAMIPLIIFAIGLFIAILLILIFAFCKCRIDE